MPFQSDSQRAWMHANHPAMAKRWERYDDEKTDKKLPYSKAIKKRYGGE